jgi:DNA-directed RNA polymerase subunit RPC12/RpoP
MCLPAEDDRRRPEFIRRFLQHVLPSGFQKLRHYGFASSNSKQSIQSVRWVVTLHYGRLFLLLTQQSPTTPPPRIRCPACGGRMIVVRFVSAEHRFAARAPPIGSAAS